MLKRYFFQQSLKSFYNSLLVSHKLVVAYFGTQSRESKSPSTGRHWRSKRHNFKITTYQNYQNLKKISHLNTLWLLIYAISPNHLYLMSYNRGMNEWWKDKHNFVCTICWSKTIMFTFNLSSCQFLKLSQPWLYQWYFWPVYTVSNNTQTSLSLSHWQYECSEMDIPIWKKYLKQIDYVYIYIHKYIFI